MHLIQDLDDENRHCVSLRTPRSKCQERMLRKAVDKENLQITIQV